MPLDTLRDHIQKTYALLRIGIALIGILFPIVVLVGGLLVSIEPQGSISAYYHTPMGDIFVGSLCAIGAFLYLYKGVTNSENIALNFAGIFIILVALLPTVAPESLECETFTAPYLHGISAILFFIAIAYVCIFEASSTLEAVQDPGRRRLYDFAYKGLGAGMIILPLASALLLYLLGQTSLVVYVVEVAAVWVFGIYWIVKTLEINETQIDRKAFEEK
ncbi:hypothetical protein U2F10_24000 [Leptothoe sp. EHU-05/26/07-4]